MKRDNFTRVDNDILLNSEISISARLLYIILVKYTYGKTYCFPSQKTLAHDIGFSSTKQIRNLLNELSKFNLISKEKNGFNKSNTYYIARELEWERKGTPSHVGKKLPSNSGSTVPANNTYIKRKDNNDANGIESVEDFLKRRGYRLARVEGLN